MHPLSAAPRTARREATATRVARVAVVALMAMIALSLSAPAAASPGEQGDSAATALGEVTLSPTPAADGFLPVGSVTASGTATAGSTIVVDIVRAGQPPQAGCTASASPVDGRWSCATPLPNGELTLRVTEFRDGDSLESWTTRLLVLGPPVISGPALGIGIVKGVGYPSALVRATATGPASAAVDCGRVDSGGSWTCLLMAGDGSRLPSGSYTVSVEQGAPGASPRWSHPQSRTLTIDTDNPPAPTVTSPAAGQRITTQPTTYAGTGENNATVSVFVSGVSAPVCTALVAGGAWSCQGTDVPRGTWLVHALQWDAAGNPGPSNLPFEVHYGRAPASAQPPLPSTPSPPPSETLDPEAVDPTPSPDEGPTSAPSADPFFPGPVPAPDRGETPPLLTWGTPTGFGWNIPTPVEAFERGNWAIAPFLGLVFVVFVALPLRMAMLLAAGSSRPRVRFFGRNRPLAASAGEDGPLVRPAIVVGGAVLGAAILAALSTGLLPESRYVRLLGAIGAGIVVLNLVGVALASRLASRALRVATWQRFVPAYLALAALATLASRMFDVHPPIVLGVLIATTIPLQIPRARRAAIALTQLVALAALATAAWIAHSAMGRVDGFWASALSEFLATVCLAGFGSAVLLTLPIRALPGRIVFAWSPLAWAVTTFVVVLLAAVVLMAGSTTLIVAAFAIPVGFAACVLAAWLWQRYVAPESRR
ncbi:hypothetical protein [Ruicaihuangia caeni]|uniref:hypothetical protein n=1 Tax=Ruicaihuangia caeni TaxID=3042517 RepID=UPI00338E29A6